MAAREETPNSQSALYLLRTRGNRMSNRGYCTRVSSRAVVAAALLTGCAGVPAPESDLPPDLLAAGDEVVAVHKPQAAETASLVRALGSSPADVSDGDVDFFVAIRKDLLDQRWFLSAYMEQFHLGDAAVAAASSLGTRVVSFQVQSDQLFVFDSSDQFKASALFDPDVILEAYPIVQLDAF